MNASGRGGPPAGMGSRSAIAAWALGMLLLAAGSVAVFLSKDAAGSVALIAAGSAFILTAAWRLVPSSIKAGGIELIWTAYQTGRQQVVNDITKSVGEGDGSDDIRFKLKQIEASYELERNAQMIELIKIMVDRGLIDGLDPESLPDALLRNIRRP